MVKDATTTTPSLAHKVKWGYSDRGVIVTNFTLNGAVLPKMLTYTCTWACLCLSTVMEQ